MRSTTPTPLASPLSAHGCPRNGWSCFDQWSGLLTYTQQLAATQEAVIKLKAELTLDAAKAASAAYSEMLTRLQEFLHTQGSLGLVTQHENLNYAVNFGPPHSSWRRSSTNRS